MGNASHGLSQEFDDVDKTAEMCHEQKLSPCLP
jgi:hypothetical protein